jgi:uncharacterized protein YjeT (DUF2065 family)
MPGLGDFVTGFGIALVLEGVIYALFPHRAASVWAMISSMPEQTLRALGLMSAAGGVFLVWLARG